MRIPSLIAGVVLLSAEASRTQEPPPAPIIIGVEPRTSVPVERTVVTGLVERGIDGSPLVLARERVYEFMPMQHAILLPYIRQTVRIVGTALPGSIGDRRLMVVHQIVSLTPIGTQR